MDDKNKKPKFDRLDSVEFQNDGDDVIHHTPPITEEKLDCFEIPQPPFEGVRPSFPLVGSIISALEKKVSEQGGFSSSDKPLVSDFFPLRQDISNKDSSEIKIEDAKSEISEDLSSFVLLERIQSNLDRTMGSLVQLKLRVNDLQNLIAILESTKTTPPEDIASSESTKTTPPKDIASSESTKITLPEDIAISVSEPDLTQE